MSSQDLTDFSVTQIPLTIKSYAQEVLEIEAQTLQKAKGQSLDDNFWKAISLIKSCRGKIVVTGMGKSGLIGRKIVSTLASLGNPSVFLHPAEAAHGDLGVLAREDILIAISQGGETKELFLVLEYAQKLGLPIVGFTGNLQSTLARMSGLVISTAVEKEACYLGLAPTASSTLTLALGDALALAVTRWKGFSEENFKELHPGGGLGKKLLQVKDLMVQGSAMPMLPLDADVKTILLTMSRGEVRGVCVIVDERGLLAGIITDGDIRRQFDVMVQGGVKAKDIMTKNPKTIGASEWAVRAWRLMEEKRINALVVTEDHDGRRPLGVIHLQDLIRHL